jgi:DHA1 family tetracycline resistance protein-like MFS transporter
MFRSPKNYRTFLTLLMTYTLDLVGYSIVFPVLAPLLLNPHLHYFAPDASESLRTTLLGILFAVFGISQFIGAPIAGILADHYGRYKIFLWSIGISVIGYAVMAWSVYIQNLSWLFIGRILTGFCSGNFALAQSATADLTDVHHRSKAFGILLGVGGLGFVAGPWIGGKLANPDWLSGSGAFIFAAIAALINLFIVFFFFVETYKPKAKHAQISLLNTFRDIRLVFHEKVLRTILLTYLLFSIGWGLFLIFSPTFLVQKFALGSDKIGDFFAYMALVWFFCSMFLNKELAGKFSARSLILSGTVTAAVGIVLFLSPEHLWPYWFIIPVALLGGALCWVNLGAIISIRASEAMQGRALGVSGSMWSIGQVVAPLLAGPLAGWNIYSPLLLGAAIVLLSFIYFFIRYQEK